MLMIYRRHVRGCPHRAEGRSYRHCRCPIHADGFLRDNRVRMALDLRDWNLAQDRVREWEAKGAIEVKPEAEPVTVKTACDEYLHDAKARNLEPATIYKFDLLFRQMQEFAAEVGLQYIKQFDIEQVRKFRASWTNQNLAARRKFENLRAFFRFCFESGWIQGNPASKMKPPKTSEQPTVPFTPQEFARIIGALDSYPDKLNRVRLRALVLLLRYSGLRLGDAVTLSRDRIEIIRDGQGAIAEGRLFLYTAKTGTPVCCPLPPFVITALEANPNAGRFYFWNGESKRKGLIGSIWWRPLHRLFELAKVSGGHAHRFRHTFAVELLLAGVPMERVSILLGHQSVRVTERHYAPWIRARQEQLEADVRRVWNSIPAGAYDTYMAHGAMLQ